MDQIHNDPISQTVTSSAHPSSRSQSSSCDSRLKSDGKAKDQVNVRKIQKAGREKLRRDRLNDQFVELGNTVDPERPKNDKASILAETIQVLEDLAEEVNRLKAEYATLSDESRELTQEKTELKEEKASIKSEIDNLNIQYQQRMRTMYPWGPTDHPVVMAPPPYAYSVPLAIPPSSIPMQAMHPTLQPFPFFGNQNPAAIPTHHSTFVPYSSRQDSWSGSSDCQRNRTVERSEESNDVATELELKTPGSSEKQELSSSVNTKRKQSQSQSHRKENAAGDDESSSM